MPIEEKKPTIQDVLDAIEKLSKDVANIQATLDKPETIKMTCERCKGTGLCLKNTQTNPELSPVWVEFTCPQCNGEGYRVVGEANE